MHIGVQKKEITATIERRDQSRHAKMQRKIPGPENNAVEFVRFDGAVNSKKLH